MNTKEKIKKLASRNAVIRRTLRKIGIDLRKNTNINSIKSVINIENRNIDIDRKYLNICSYVSGGIGDNIISIGTLLNIKKKINCRTKIYIYTERVPELIKLFEMNEDIKIVDAYFFENDMQLYDISFFMAHKLVLKYVNMTEVEKKCPELIYFIKKICKENEEYKFYIDSNPLADGILAQKEMLMGRNRWTELNVGTFINTPVVPVHLDMNDMDFMKKINVPYITVNFGSDTHFACIQPKVWPRENFEAFIALIHETYPSLKVVQVGSAGTPRLKGTDYAMLGESFSRIKVLLKHSLLHIDSEGGLVHLCRQLKTKCAVLFGPTWQEYFGYAENININAHACLPCMWVDDKWQYRCIRGDAVPRCMQAITPERVLKEISGYLDSCHEAKFTVVDACLYRQGGVAESRDRVMDICRSAHAEYLDQTHHIYGDGDTYIHASKQWEYPYVVNMLHAQGMDAGTICDVGAGRGMLDGYLSDRGYDVTVCDMDYTWDTRHEDATFRYEQYAKHKGFKAEIGTIFNLPYEDESFDVVLCISVIEHVLHKEYALQELLRVVKKGGYVLLTFDIKHENSTDFGRSEVATPRMMKDVLGVTFKNDDLDRSIHDIAEDGILGIPEGMTVGGVVLRREG